jgi:DNA-binding transcriptional ArsR family regulator
MSSTRTQTHVDILLSALADPTRRTIFEAVLADPGVTTSALCEQTKNISRWGVIKHMTVLRDAGLIQTMATGRLRRHYAERSALGSLNAWLERVSR